MDEKSVVVVEPRSRFDKKTYKNIHRRRALCAGATIIPIFIFALIGLMIFDIILETSIIARVPESSLLVKGQAICTPKVLNASKIEYHSSHQYYSILKKMTPLPLPVFRKEVVELCDEEKQSEKLYNYCLPITGRKDTPFCEAADRLDLLNLPSSKLICYASVLHMIMVEVYEELEATGNIPFLVFGSLLGAVRNGSMIPFTEDADIGFIGELAAQNTLRTALRKKGYHMFFMDIWRVCVAPTHPLAGHLYNPNLPITDNYAAPYLDLYTMKHQGNGDWDMEELEGNRMDLLNSQSSKSICYASVLHMLMVEVYEELQAIKHTPLLLFGSLLGAVRNKSMIPFTEDADIGFIGVLYDPNLPINTTFAVPYLDLYSIKQQGDGNWDIQELNASNGSILPDSKVQPFSQVAINGMSFDTVHDPEFFLDEAYGEDYMMPKPREIELVGQDITN
ncbi:hypothetical protein BBO99_00006835 [Phytophthora kernoviae]|uniref:LicD family protein n=2 Tax=Phytophthora kernoviae TaxID=325452 RepID=A0A3R7KRZ3_9STRA|nr:hypothetical protein G195_010052 [Phytophthora kernoviae 00238/432]KAG2521069.1 hypothetical protein JM16_005682 [Phytophthora kernoviae]KAG2522311.1 hypothetical protein JM18_006234 [Phytophthora kernoviae]RLN15277.1 hypothetical protein BBI17_006020 [Phytophthora kernoviae]RLN77333.1 hypothetical protein BBO99_00006835 [Phytophthora kernoviae]